MTLCHYYFRPNNDDFREKDGQFKDISIRHNVSLRYTGINQIRINENLLISMELICLLFHLHIARHRYMQDLSTRV